MGTNVTLGAAAGATVAAEAEVGTGLETGWAVAGLALADGLALDGAPAPDDALAPQADSASPTPRPRTAMLTILVVRLKCRKLAIISPHRPQPAAAGRTPAAPCGWLSGMAVILVADRMSGNHLVEVIAARWLGCQAPTVTTIFTAETPPAARQARPGCFVRELALRV